MRFYVTDEINQKQKEILAAHGYYAYDMRDWDDENGYNIEIGHVTCNNIGVVVTDTDMSPWMNYDRWIGSDEFGGIGLNEELPYKDIEPYLASNRNTNFHFHIKGKICDAYVMYRTYDFTIAKEKLTRALQLIKEKDPTARAYQFGRSKDSRAFWKILKEIKKGAIETGWSLI